MLNKIRILLLIILVLAFWKFLFGAPRVANDFPYIYQVVAQTSFDLPRLWSTRTAEGMGENVISTLWAWPMDVLYGLGAKMGLGFGIMEKVLAAAPFLALGIWGITRFLKRFGISGWGSLAASLLYLANTYVFLLLDGGQMGVALAYVWFPTAYLAFIDGTKGDFRKKVVTGLAFWVMGLLDIRFLYILALVIILRFSYELVFLGRGSRVGLLFNWAKTALLALVILCGLNAYWLVPALLGNSFSLPVLFQRSLDASAFSFSNLGHSFFLLQPHWYNNVFGKITELKAEFFIIPALVFLAPILKKKSKEVGFWLLVAVVGVFLVKGTNPPLAGVYTWLSQNIPGFLYFRDSSKFFFLVALSYSFLIGVTVSELSAKFKAKYPVIPITIFIYFLYLISPVYLGKLTGTFSKPLNQEKYLKLAQAVQQDNYFGRILWVPAKTPLGYSSPIHPSLEALRLINLRPFAQAVRGTYEITNFLRAPHIGQILDIAGISYVAYPFPDTRREELKADNIEYFHWFNKTISNYPWVESTKDFGDQDSPINLFKTKTSQDKFFIAENTWLVVGSDDVYSELVNVPNFNLSDNALLFLEERPGLFSFLDPSVVHEFSGTVLNNKDPLDLWVSQVAPEFYIFPAEGLKSSPDESGWWKREGADLISWRGFLQQKYFLDNSDFDYGGGWAVGEGKLELRIKDEKLRGGNRLLARVMLSSKGGSLVFHQDGDLIGELNSRIENPEKVVWEEESDKGEARVFDKANFSWFEVGNLVSDSDVVVKSEGEINVVNALISVPEAVWEEINRDSQPGKIELDLAGAEAKDFEVESQVTVTYEELSPTEYKVNISGMDGLRPHTLVFSTTYNHFWKMEGEETFPVYGFLNGFIVSRDGEYTITFETQKYVVPGLLISFFVLGASLLYLVIKR